MYYLSYKCTLYVEALPLDALTTVVVYNDSHYYLTITTLTQCHMSVITGSYIYMYFECYVYYGLIVVDFPFAAQILVSLSPYFLLFSYCEVSSITLLWNY